MKKVIVFAVAFLAMICATTTWTLNRKGSINDPPAPWNTDGVYYDNIAFNLIQGDGFVVDLQAQPWRKTFCEANSKTRLDGQYDWLMSVKGTGPTALRSPAYPFTLAAIYQTFGHRYRVSRVFGCLFVSAGLALLLTFCALQWGYVPAMIAAATLALDYSVMESAGTLATESLAILVLAATFLLAVRAWNVPTHGNWFVCGVGFAMLLLTRGIWSLGLLIMIGLLTGFMLPAVRNRMTRLKLTHFFVFLSTAMLVATPWWVRNCMVTRHFQPFGTAGACGFVAAYCDESLANYGQWQPKVFNDNQREVQATVDMETVNLAHLEYLTGQESMRKTKEWCLRNWTRIPQLMLFRGLSHWGLFNPSVPTVFQTANLWLVGIGLAGCFCCTGKLRALFIFVLLIDSLMVMLTWEHLGRYSIPIRPVVHLGYGLAIFGLIKAALARFSNRTETSDPKPSNDVE